MSIRAELTDGSIVELEKDCGCTHHDGPHWLHENRVWRQLIKQDCDCGGKGMSEFLYLHCLGAQLRCVDDLLANMHAAGVVRIVREEQPTP